MTKQRKTRGSGGSGSRNPWTDEPIIGGRDNRNPTFDPMSGSVRGSGVSVTPDGSSPSAPDPLNGSYGVSGTLRDNAGGFYGNLNGLNSSAFAQFLASFLQGGDVSKDVLPTILEAIFNQAATNDQRAYDWQLTQNQRAWDWNLLKDQRTYDNATNQLARLMGAGISRDQAIQLLSGSPSASAIGASSPVHGSASTVSQPPIPNSADVANSVFNGISAFSGLVSMGFSVAQAFQQVKFAQNQNYLNSEQIKAYNVSSQAYNLIKSSGIEVTDDVFSSVGNTANFISQMANDGDVSAQQFVANGNIDLLRSTAPYSSPMLSQLYRDERSAKDYATSFRNNMDLMRAGYDLQRVNIDNVRAGILQIEQNIENLRASEQYTIAQTNLANKAAELTGKDIEVRSAQVGLIRKQSELTSAQTGLTSVQTQLTAEQVFSQSLQNDLDSSWRNEIASDGRSGLQLYSDYQINRLYGDVMELCTLNDRQVWQKHADAILGNYDNSIALYELGTLYANGEIDAYNSSDDETKDLLNFCRAAEKSGLFPYVQTVANAETAGNWSFYHAGGSEAAKGAKRVITDLDKRRKRYQRQNN